ncbi:MAG: DeoR/GlpR transcriptional regulator [Candidatus Competibacteraceae bacterium]|nr:DeoR/GlpR transcriptional regulator [Candidatus Competibacteraceae bacterium]
MVSDAPSRQRIILNCLQERETLRNAELQKILGTTAMTLWRDLQMLEERGLVRRLRGRVTRTERSLHEPDFHSKTDLARHAKERIAAYATVKFINVGDILSIDGGTTVAALARQALPPKLSILTNSLYNAEAFLRHPARPAVYLCGGLLREKSGTFIGREALSFFGKRRSHTYFLSASGVDAKAGVTDLTVEDNEVKRAMAAGSERIVLLADADKISRVSLLQVFPIKRIGHLVTNAGAKELETIKRLVPEILLHSVIP